ncbi:hypothetical protein T05_11330 [Trichinella murrelli]|uniref:Uncharacterized protein n=1 Tax=Trichinella murrelli TaxID=144512 RepID=A0A0V0SVG2_9BILA|nr:hypothetical protein T05_11330 [Trichinella murrelli]
MQYFNKLEFREIPTFPLFTSKRSIHICTYGYELLHEFNYSL